MTDLESFREMFKDKRVHLVVAKITKVAMVSDRSALKVLVNVFPEGREIFARMSWSAVGPEAGFFIFPNVGDLVIVGVVDEDEQECFVLSRMTSLEDKIPLNAVSGDLVAKSLSGKKAWLTSDTRINLSKGDAEPTENLVLGQVFKGLASDWLDVDSRHMHICMPPGFLSQKPMEESEYLALKASPVDDESVLSDLSFTEK